jgi:hypothetical protein
LDQAKDIRGCVDLPTQYSAPIDRDRSPSGTLLVN